MLNGIFSTLSGKTANELKLDIIANNVANALTPGFKALEPAFSSSTLEYAIPVGEVGTAAISLAGLETHTHHCCWRRLGIDHVLGLGV